MGRMVTVSLVWSTEWCDTNPCSQVLRTAVL
jgi:hypothetical protein